MDLFLLLTAFIAGLFSILAPCAITILPVVFARNNNVKNPKSPFWVLLSLAISIIIFSILLKSTTFLINIPPKFWQVFSGSIIIFFGLILLFPSIWEKISQKFNLLLKSQQLLGKSNHHSGRIGDIILGISLGPLFSACSPTYLLIVAIILPSSPLQGLIYLALYVIGLCLMIWLVIKLGYKLISKLNWGLDQNNIFHKILGLILIILGIFFITGLDKTILGLLVEGGIFDWQVNIEEYLRSIRI